MKHRYGNTLGWYDYRLQNYLFDPIKNTNMVSMFQCFNNNNNNKKQTNKENNKKIQYEVCPGASEWR